MKILLFGHSYVRHLERLGNWDRELSLTSGKKVDCKFLFKSHPGKDYGYLLRNPQEFEIIRLINWPNSIEFACVCVVELELSGLGWSVHELICFSIA